MCNSDSQLVIDLQQEQSLQKSRKLTCRLAARAHKSRASSTGTSLLLSMAHSAASAKTCTTASALELLEIHGAAMHVKPFQSHNEQLSPNKSTSVTWTDDHVGASANGDALLSQQGLLTSYMRLSGRPGTSGMTTAAMDVSGICCRVCAIALDAPAMTHARA